MKRVVAVVRCVCAILCVVIITQCILGSAAPVRAYPSILSWTVVDTPAEKLATNIIVRKSEVNAIAVGSDGMTLYAVDIPNNKIYTSVDIGVTWPASVDLAGNLSAAGAQPPSWNIAIAPDDVTFVVAITDGDGTPNGPKNVFVSTDGGQNWVNTNFTSSSDEFISCVAVSSALDSSRRYIAVGTRRNSDILNPFRSQGRVLIYKGPGPSSWVPQTVAPSQNWVPGDVVALQFSPSYALDSTIAVVYASTSGLFLNYGFHDVIANSTTWKSGLGFPVRIRTTPGYLSPKYDEIITADLELPADFSGTDPGSMRICWVSFDARTNVAPITYFSGVYRVDNTRMYQQLYNTSPQATPSGRISSITYDGTCDTGKLLAGEVTTDPNRGLVNTWRCNDPFRDYNPGWTVSDQMKSPTGGGTSGRANALLACNTSSGAIYCFSSSANLSVPGTSISVPGTWPVGLLTKVELDESAFSVCTDSGKIWNQLSLIDTEITRLADVAVIEAPEDSEDYSVLYLTSVNSGAGTRFDSIWRSISEPLSVRWERVLCMPHINDDLILRLNPRITDTNVRSKVIVCAYLNTLNFGYIRCSEDEGQNWQVLYPNVAITDLTLSSDTTMYILMDTYVVKGVNQGVSWNWGTKENTRLTEGHSITTPLNNPTSKQGQMGDWVIVGSKMVGEVTYADFSKVTVKFEPSDEQGRRLPAPGDVHVLADEQFEANTTIYAANGNVGNGKIYRWVIGKSTVWDELQPLNSNFHGLEQKRGVLYGAFDLTAIPYSGVDRTLYPRVRVPPPPEWDDLTAELPGAVRFTREPSALKISGGVDTNLWAIDNQPFSWATPKQGCLWNYTDTLARKGPWTTAPASSDVIAVDPVTGRANEVNFDWRQLSYARGYELQIAKDQDFILRVFVNDNIVPFNSVSPAWVQFPGLLEAGHKYFWRVRARHATTGEIIRSPWSTTMYFTAMAGFAVQSKHLGPTLLHPPNYCVINNSAPAFSWSPMFQTTSYRFVLARDAALTQIIDEAVVDTTAYEYKGNLGKGTYFWQVKAIKPMVSEASPIGSFAVTDSAKSTSLLGIEISESISLCIWIGILIYGVFAIAMLALIMRTRYRR